MILTKEDIVSIYNHRQLPDFHKQTEWKRMMNKNDFISPRGACACQKYKV